MGRVCNVVMRYETLSNRVGWRNLWKAMEEASSADYGDAINFASTAEKYADKAILLSKQAHEGSGR